jgi:16S rRNA G1207 methylase RsmC
MITALIRESPGVLKSDGKIILVAQKRLPVERELRRAFRGVERLADGLGFQVWKGESPRG